MKAIRIQTEYLDDPIGIANPRPRLFWNAEGEGFQQAVRLVYSVNGGKLIIMEKKTSSMHVDFPRELSSRDHVDFTLVLQDEEGHWGEESQTHSFEIGLLSPLDWKASWISGDYSPNKKDRYPVDGFQKVFVSKPVKKARLYITALGLYEASINGNKVGDRVLMPGSTDYRKRVAHQVYDVTSLLKEGENRLNLLLADGWYRGSIGAKGRRCIFGKQTKLLAQLEILNDDGTKNLIVSDGGFSWSNDGPIRFADLKDGEIVDARKTYSYSGKARVVKAKANVVPSNQLPLTENESFLATEVIQKAPNKKIFCFKQNLAGYISFEVDAKAGQRIDIRMGEMLDDEGEVTLKNVQCIHKGKRTPLQEIHYICKDGHNVYKTKFYFGGFRYVEVVGEPDVRKENLHQIAIYSHFEETSHFECNNPLINTFYRNSLWSLKSNSIDVPTDCPTRERMGWTGDSQVFFNTASYLVDYAPFAAKHLDDVFDRQWRSGRLPQIAPFNAEDWYMFVMNGSVGWADVGILMPYYAYLKYGDERFLKRYYAGMARYAKFMMRRQGKWGGVYAKPMHLKHRYAKYAVNCGQSYGEWAEPADVKSFVWTDFASPHPEVSTAYTAWVLSIFLKVSDILGQPHDDFYEKVKMRSEGAKIAYQALRKTKAYSLDTDRQAELVRPLYMDLLTQEQTEYAKKRLIEALDHYKWRLGTGFLSTPFILDVLSSIDPEYAYRLLENEECPGWLFMAKNDTGTIWEGWEGPKSEAGIASLNHYSKGALVEWLMRGMCGIHVDGENHFLLTPIVGGKETQASASYSSVYGKVSLSFKVTKEGTSFLLNIPCNTTADFVFGGVTKHLEPGHYEFTI